MSWLVWLNIFCLSGLSVYVIDMNNKGRLFDGVGGMSFGATSRLLIDYEEPYRSQILDYLFKPSFGASLNILKVEIGGDTWTTCGSEPSHMHNENDLNYYRGYEYWLMNEAKKRNENIKFYGLSIGFPAWIGSGALNENQANYTYLWVKGAEQEHNLTISWLGIWNEENWNPTYVKLLRKTLDDNNLQHVRLVLPDMPWLDGVNTVLSDMKSDPQFASSFDIIGVHYPPSSQSNITGMSNCGKILWSSEDFSTHNNQIGAGCWARLLNWNYIYGNYTATLMWSLISSWYEYLPYYGDGIMNAAWPWNGHYEVMSPIWITAHTTQFVNNNDWNYIKIGSGSGVLKNGGTYITLTDGNDITIVIETMQYEYSLCMKSNPPNNWNVVEQNISFQFINWKQYPKLLYQWKSVLFGENIFLFEKQESISINESDGTFVLYNVLPNCVITLSTISNGNKGSYPTPPNKINFTIPYSDNFDSYSQQIKNGYDPQPKYFSDQTGSFAVRHALNSTNTNYVLEQVVPYSPSANNTGWHNQDAPQPLTIIGDHNLSDINVSVSTYMISNNPQTHSSLAWNTPNIIIGLRMGGSFVNNGNGCNGDIREYPCVQALGKNWFMFGYMLQINDNGYWKLMAGVNNPILIDGNLNINLREIWFNVSLSIKGYALSATFNDKLLFNSVDDVSKRFISGWSGLSCGWQTCQFDNFIMQ